MSDILRAAWKAGIAARDYEEHMAAVGQAQANASLVEEAFIRWPPGPGWVAMAGVGSGQIFDYWDGAALRNHSTVFTDLSEVFLRELRRRRPGCAVVADDIENSALAPVFMGVIVVLVLEHVDWRHVVQSLARICEGRCYIVIQENSRETPALKLRGTMAVLREAGSVLVDRAELIEAMGDLGFGIVGETERVVPDSKRMRMLVFECGPVE